MSEVSCRLRAMSGRNVQVSTPRVNQYFNSLAARTRRREPVRAERNAVGATAARAESCAERLHAVVETTRGGELALLLFIQPMADFGSE
jgi:hypothetical protein